MTSADPRHGRWILPLMIAAMVVLTYTFVNTIEPAASPSGSTIAGGSTTTAPDTSTTTLPPELAAFMVTLDIFEDQATEFGEEVTRINTEWDNRSILFAEARTALVDLEEKISNWETDVAQVTGVPPILAAGHVALVIEVSDLAPKMEDIIAGLDASDDGTLRRAATAEFQALVVEVLDAIEAIRQTARDSVAPATDADA